MAFDHNLAGIGQIPGDLEIAGSYSLDGSGLTLNDGATILMNNVSSSLTQDITIEALNITTESKGSLYLALLEGAPTHYLLLNNFGQYSSSVHYKGSGESNPTSKTALGVNPSWSHKDGQGNYVRTKLRVVFDGSNLKLLVNDVLVNTHTLSPSDLATVASSKAKIHLTGAGSVNISRITAFEYLNSISNDKPKLGDTVTVTGTFPAHDPAQDNISLTINGITEDISSQIVSWTTSSITFTVNPTGLPYGKGTLSISDSTGNSGSRPIELLPEVSWDYVNISDAIQDHATIKSLFDGVTGTFAPGAQIKYKLLPGFNPRSDGTYTSTVSGAVEYRLFDPSDNTWSGLAVKTITVQNSTPTNISNMNLVVNPTNFTVSVVPDNNTGRLYYVVSKCPVRPTPTQMKLGVDAYNKAGILAGDVNPTDTINANGLSNGSYNIYLMQETAGGKITNTLFTEASILGVPVVPVISQQPTSGSIQESISVSAKIFEFQATPANAIKWQQKVGAGAWTDIFGANTNRYEVRGNQFVHTDSPMSIRAWIEGEGGASTYTDEVTLTITEPPFIEINIPAIGTRTARLVLVEESVDRTKFHDADINIVNGYAKVVVDHFSGRNYVGHVYFNDATKGWDVGTGIKGTTQ